MADEDDRCSGCSSDLSGVPPAARFCPHCGGHLSDSRHLIIKRIDPTPTTAVVRGYASAMFRLGFHYETRHNDDEAVRCYGKASRLGNAPAEARMSEIPVALRADDPRETPVS